MEDGGIVAPFKDFTQKSLNPASGYSDFIQGDSVKLSRELSSVNSKKCYSLCF